MKKGLIIFLVYSGITLALTWPLAAQLGSVLPNDAGDPALNTWILWWNTQAMPLTEAWWSAPVFFPATGVLSFSEHLLGLSLLSAPLSWLGTGPQAAYNIVFLLTFPLSAIGGYLLAYELTRRRDAAFIAGLLFGFAPYRIAHLPQIQSLASFPMPFALLGLHRYLRDPQRRWLALFAGGWLLQALCNGYYLLFFSVFVGLWLLWFASPLARPREFLAISAAGILGALPILPLLLRYRHIHEGFGFERDFETIRQFGADAAGLLHAAHHLALWGSLHVFRRAEGELFPGLTLTALLVAGAVFLKSDSRNGGRWIVVRRLLTILAAAIALVSLYAVAVGSLQVEAFGVRLLSMRNPIEPLMLSLLLIVGLALTGRRLRRAYATRSVLAFYAVGGLVMWAFSLGPTPTLMGNPLADRGPYALLMVLPGFNSLRVPARFWMVATLCLAIVGAIVFTRLAARIGRIRPVLTGIVILGVLADTWMSAMPLVDTPKAFAALDCAAPEEGGVIELPLGYPYPDVAAMYRQMDHQRPLANGYSGYFPPHYAALRFGLALRDPDVLSQLAAAGITYVIVNRELQPKGRWDAYVSSHAKAQLLCTEGQQSLYRVGPPPSRPDGAASARPLAMTVIRANVNSAGVGAMIDRDRTSRWESGPQRSGTAVDIDLGRPQPVTGIDLLLGPYVEDFPRGLVIETSIDGHDWLEVWQGGSAGLAFSGAFEAPREVPLRYRFAATEARLLRLRLTREDPTYYWSIAEVAVVGP